MLIRKKLCLLAIVCSCLLSFGYEQKKIIFTGVQCLTKSNKVIKVECSLEDESVLNILMTTNNREVSDLVGIADLKVSMTDKKKQIRFKNFQLDICKILNTKSPSSTFVGVLEKGIQKSLYNFPKKCPLKQNTTYKLQRMKFDVNYFPAYLPEYNLTFNANFLANKVNSFDLRLTGALCYKNNDCSGAGSGNSSNKIEKN